MRWIGWLRRFNAHGGKTQQHISAAHLSQMLWSVSRCFMLGAPRSIVIDQHTSCGLVLDAMPGMQHR